MRSWQSMGSCNTGLGFNSDFKMPDVRGRHAEIKREDSIARLQAICAVCPVLEECRAMVRNSDVSWVGVFVAGMEDWEASQLAGHFIGSNNARRLRRELARIS